MGVDDQRPGAALGGEHAQNEWKASEIVSRSNNRLVPTASIPLLDVDLAIAELQHAAGIGLHVLSLPTGVPEGLPDYNHDHWEPLWAAADEAGMVLGFHIGSDNDGKGNTPFRGPGGAVLNYVNTTFGGQFVAMKLVTGGALTGTRTSRCSSRKAARPGCRSSVTA